MTAQGVAHLQLLRSCLTVGVGTALVGSACGGIRDLGGDGIVSAGAADSEKIETNGQYEQAGDNDSAHDTWGPSSLESRSRTV